MSSRKIVNNKKTKVYIYTRVSTVMQIDGYSLEAQKNKMKNYAEFNDFKIAGEYEDAGKSIEERMGKILYLMQGILEK